MFLLYREKYFAYKAVMDTNPADGVRVISGADAWHGCKRYLERWPLTEWAGFPPAHYHEGCNDTRFNLSDFHVAARNTTARFVERFDSARLVFMGDSISRQLYVRTVCFLIGSITAENDQAPRPRHVLAQHRSSELNSSTPRVCVDLLLRVRATSVPPSTPAYRNASFCMMGVMSDDASVAGKALKRLAADGWLGPRSLVVANLGIHFPPTSALEAAVRNLVQTHADLPSALRPSLVWRETAAQHFPTSNGLYAAGSGRATMSAVPHLALCRPLRFSNRSTVDLYNAISRAPVEAAHVPILRVWEHSSAAWDAHPAATRGHHGKDVLDCTHYCTPSEELGHWVRELLPMTNMTDAYGGPHGDGYIGA